MQYIYIYIYISYYSNIQTKSTWKIIIRIFDIFFTNYKLNAMRLIENPNPDFMMAKATNQEIKVLK